MKNNIYKYLALIIILVFSVSLFAGVGGSKKGRHLQKVNLLAGDAYRMFINNLDMPFDKTGVVADVAVDGPAGGALEGTVFLFSGGFFLSGLDNGKIWANAVASASRIQDYVPGTVASGRNDSRAQIYVLKFTDGDFAESWNEWKDAVALGAYFYDGNGDGVYNPVDLNGNGKWDPTEDRPDLLGDQTAWCVFNDGEDPALRTFNDVEPKGIEIRETIFGFNSKDVVGNMLFLRYSILNTGTVSAVYDSVYLGVWADPDLGDPYDDLVGCDTASNSGFVYNDGDDTEFGPNPPCFLIDFFQGPITYIPGKTYTDVNGNGVFDEGTDIPLDTAYNVQGQTRGVAIYPGAMNLGLSSFVHYMQSHPTLGDPNTRIEARHYMLGLDRDGNTLDPATWAFGTVVGGVDPKTINPHFFYSGDPVKQIGWLNNTPTDQRQMSNTGPFKLEAGKPVDIVVAYVIGRGKDALESVTLAKNNDQTAQILFDANFPSPPPPPPVAADITTGDDYIDITWSSDKQISYRAIDTVLGIDRSVQGFYVDAYNSNSKATSVGGITNIKEIANYEVDNQIKNIYVIASNGGKDLVRTEASASNKLDSALYADPSKGRIKLRIDKDPFTGNPLVKGKEYYFTLTIYTLNHKPIVELSSGTYGPEGDYYDPIGGAYGEYETQIYRVTFGKDLYDPASEGAQSEKTGGAAKGHIKYLIVDKDQLTGDSYEVDFFKDSKAAATSPYTPFWKLTNTTKNLVLIDSSKVYDYDTTNFAGASTDGFIVRVQPVEPTIGTVKYIPSVDTWYKSFASTLGRGIFYVGQDISQGGSPTSQNIGGALSNVISADKLKQVEIRFGTTGKAYRYLNGYIGGPFSKKNSFAYAGAVTASDTVSKGPIGKLGEGFVDVPFTAWVKDSLYKQEYQLAVGFIETNSTDYKGTPDGIWDPGTTIQTSQEFIIIFDAPYDPQGGQIEYTGGDFNTASGIKTVWADLIKGFTIPDDAQGISDDQKRIAKSKWFNALYVVGLERKDETSFYKDGDKFIIPISQYPYTENDKYTFTTRASGKLTQDEKKQLFNKVNVFPNPLFAYIATTGYEGGNPDEPFVTFSNLPDEVTVKIYTLSGLLIRTLRTSDKSAPTSPFLRWNLENDDGLRVASGVYLAIVSSPGFGEKILKFSIIMPQKQIQRF